MTQRAEEQHALRAEQAVGDPRAEDRRQVDRAAVRADDAGRRRLGDPEAALGDGVVHVDEQDALHAVEAEPLPHLDAEDVRERPRLPEEPRVVVGAVLGRRGPSGVRATRRRHGAGPRRVGRRGRAVRRTDRGTCSGSPRPRGVPSSP